MKYLETIAKAYGYSIKKGSSDGYNGYRIFNRHNVSVGVFFDSLDSVAEFFAKKIQSQQHLETDQQQDRWRFVQPQIPRGHGQNEDHADWY